MKFNLKLSHKGVILVSVPLLFEVIFVVALAIMLERTEQIAQREANSRAVVAAGIELSNCILDGGFALLTWQYNRRPAFIARFEDDQERVPQILSRLRQLVHGNVRQQQHLVRLDTYSKRVLFLFQQYGKIPIEEHSLLPGLITINQFRIEMEKSFAPLMAEVKALADEEREEQSKTPQEEEYSKNAVRLILAAGLFVNAVIGIILALFFSRNISGRIAVLIDNARRVTERQPLNKPVSGFDEVAILDRTFHDMVEALMKSEQQKQEFISMISHDLRTPLTSLQGCLALAINGVYGDINKKGLDRFTAAEDNLERLIHLISEMLDFEKLEAGMLTLNCRKTPLQGVFERAIRLIDQFAEQSGVNLVAEPTSLCAYVDSDRLTQVLVNLASNGVKFSPAGSDVHMAARTLAGGEIEISVRDGGIGMPADRLEKIFERFQQIPGQQQIGVASSGLGLAIARAIVQAHKGKIWAESEEGKGTTFFMRLPAQTGAVVPVLEES